MAKTRGDFTDLLVQKGLISSDQLTEARGMAQQTGAKLQDTLVKLGYVTLEQVIGAVAEHSGLEYIDLTNVTIPPAVVELVPESVARENVVLPLAQDGNVLKIVTSDPSDFDTVQKLQFILNKDITPVIAAREQIIEAINRHYGQTETESVDSMLAEFTDTAIDFTETEQTLSGGAEESDAPVVKLCNLIIQEAIALRASDIHIEPFEDRVRVRYRIDGVLVERDSPPRRLLAPMISRLKIMGNIDISEKRRPQDGRIKTEYKSREVELRVSTMPTAFGEKIVIRIFDPDVLLQDLEELGFAPHEYELFRSFITRPHGVLLVTGPTGSGKTTTLYSALKTVCAPEVNVVTIEDPIEMVYDKFNQVSIQPQIGVTFGSMLRTILRQDPDIIMVGEIRDLETVENAVQAALTGHLVFSTLHTNDAPSAITRLLDLGVPSYLISSSIIGIMAQRLVRQICRHCEKTYELLPEEAQAVGLSSDKNKKVTVKYGEGCPQCRGTGYMGRSGIFEVMEVNDKIRDLIRDKSDADLIRKAAIADGMVGLREAAVQKMLKGETTFDEVIRVTGEKM